MAKLSNRTFGVEFETFFSLANWKRLLRDYKVEESNDPFSDAGKILNKIGLPGWEAEPDASIKGGDVQIEFKTPILQGPNGLKQVLKFCNILKQYAQVNESAGVHVHVGAFDFKEPGAAAERLTMALLHYKNVEDLFDNLTMAHRRGNASYYARSPYSAARIIAQYKSIITSHRKTLISLVNSLQDERYMKLNLESLIDHGTIEFRQMHGTLNGELVKNWIIICTSFLDTVRETEGYFAEMISKLKEDKTEMKAEMTDAQRKKVAEVFVHYVCFEIVKNGLSHDSTNADFKRVVRKDIKGANANTVAERVYPYIQDIQTAAKDGKEYLYFYVPAKAFEFLFTPGSIGYGLKLACDAFKEESLNAIFARNATISASQEGIRVLMRKNAAQAVAEEYLGAGSTKVNISKDYLDTIEKSRDITRNALPSRNVANLGRELQNSPMYEGKK